MFVDTRTLLCATVLVLLQLAAFLFFAWNKNRSVVTLLWWSGALAVQGLGVSMILLRQQIPPFYSIELSNALLIFSAGMMWNGARLFHERPASFVAGIGSLVWLAGFQFDAFRDQYAIRLPVFMGFISTYMILAAYEYLRSAERLPSRIATILCFFVSGLVYALPLPLALIDGQRFIEGPGIQVWFAVTGLQTIVFNLTASQLILLQTKERIEQRYRRAALTDGLTGVANRAHFMQSSIAILEQFGAGSRPLSLVLFDLDHFKAINDQSGHLTGDAVLSLFAEVAQSCLRKDDLFGRVGGEEFGALLVDCDAKLAESICERIRVTFKDQAREQFDQSVRATVSAGVVTMHRPGVTFRELFASADSALYQAKHSGRDRTEVFAKNVPSIANT